MLEDPEINLCVVATSNDAHLALAEQCLKAGRHVVVDKPLALSSQDAAYLAHLAAEHHVILSAYHNRRWDGDYQTIRKLLEDGRMGRPLQLVSHFDRFRPLPRLGSWRESGQVVGGGLLFDIGPHLLDQALALLGTPTDLWADVRKSRDGAVLDDAFDIMLTYEDSPRSELRGLRVWLCATLTAVRPGARFILHGTKASYEKWGLDPQENALKGGQTFTDPGFGVETSAAWGMLSLDDGTSEQVPTLAGDYRGYYSNVRDAILGRAPLQVTVRDAWKVAWLIELARESSNRGARLPIDFSAAP
jgi:predicted dehydrogenase